MSVYTNFLDEIPYDYLDNKQKEIVDLIGIDAYIILVKEFGGEFLYIVKAETIAVDYRNKRIIELFDGSNYKALAKQFDLTERYVRKIVNRMRNKKEVKHGFT